MGWIGLADAGDLPRAMDELGLPLVVKIPDGSFSRGVHKVNTPEEFRRVADELFEETDLLLTQKFLPTEFDWRVGVLAGEPLFVCQYRMARGRSGRGSTGSTSRRPTAASSSWRSTTIPISSTASRTRSARTRSGSACSSGSSSASSSSPAVVRRVDGTANHDALTAIRGATSGRCGRRHRYVTAARSRGSTAFAE
jgi:hypothetical protein